MVCLHRPGFLIVAVLPFSGFLSVVGQPAGAPVPSVDSPKAAQPLPRRVGPRARCHDRTSAQGQATAQHQGRPSLF